MSITPFDATGSASFPTLRPHLLSPSPIHVDLSNLRSPHRFRAPDGSGGGEGSGAIECHGVLFTLQVSLGRSMGGYFLQGVFTLCTHVLAFTGSLRWVRNDVDGTTVNQALSPENLTQEGRYTKSSEFDDDSTSSYSNNKNSHFREIHLQCRAF